jgi:lysophospholipase L1-like esterase
MKFVLATCLIAALAVIAPAQKRLLTIFLAGDSTCAAKQPDKRPETGWGEMLGQYFKNGLVKIDNRAMNGRSTKTFITEGRWQSIVDELKKGDYVLIQFGHNDESKEKGERYTPPEDYRTNLMRMIAGVKAKGGHPVLLTPVMRRRFDSEGKFYDTHGEYPDIVRSVAKAQSVPFIDIHRMSGTLIVNYGIEGSRKLFLQLKPGENANYPAGIDDNTHFSPLGADEIAKLVIDGIRESKIGLQKYLK